MNEATNIYSKLHDQTKFRWNEINKSKDYFNAGIQERKKTKTKKNWKKNFAAFDYFEKTLTVLCARFSLKFSLTIRIIFFFENNTK